MRILNEFMSKPINYLSNSPEETRKIAARLASKVKGGEVFFLYGDLGSGKTTFTSGFINYFQKNKRVLSPTFIIVRHYEIDKHPIQRIYHMDLYRLTEETEVSGMGIAQLTSEPQSVTMIEWPEKIENLVGNRINIRLKIINDTQRSITVWTTKK